MKENLKIFFQNKTYQIKNKILTKEKILKWFLVLFLIILALFLFINQKFLNFAYNGFTKIFKESLQVYYIDVGQASANVIIFPNKSSMIIDTGSGQDVDKFLQDVKFIFNQNKIKQIDYLVLTHSDEDHIGGTVALLNEFDVKTIFRPKLISNSEFEVENIYNFQQVDTKVYDDVISNIYSEENVQVEFVEEQTLYLDGATITFYTAEDLTVKDTNYYSPFVIIDYFDKTFLFTGDADQKREKELIDFFNNNKLSLEVEFFSVAHHGSSTSSGQDFLEFINPQYAMISAGDSMFPAQSVIDRLEDVDVENIFVTKDDGLIGVGVNKNGFDIKTLSDFLDLPVYCVLLCCGVFAIANIKTNKKRKLFVKKDLKINQKSLYK